MCFNVNDLFSSALTRLRLPPESLHRDSPVDRFRLCSLSAMNRGEIVLIAMLDCSKWFDTIDHATLLSILKLYGVDIKWFRSYLSGHFQRCRLPQSRRNLQIKVGEHFNRYLPGHGRTGILLGLSAARQWLPREVLITLVDSLALSRIR